MNDARTSQHHTANPRASRNGLAMILSSPSGAGKTTLSRRLIHENSSINLSISVTTRMRRSSEADGIDYHFISIQDFATLRDGDELLEWAEVHDHHYGTPRAPVEQALAAGQDMLFDIDWQGAAQISEKLSTRAISIFILPPSMAELQARLERRAEDSADTIARRLDNAREEIKHWHEYDYVIINHDLDDSARKLKDILAVERLKRIRNQQSLQHSVDALLAP